MVDIEDIILRIEKAKSAYSDARFCMDAQRWDVAVNRLYYALFHIVSALLESSDIHVKSHSGLQNVFYTEFIAKGRFGTDEGKLLARLEDAREKSDYNLGFKNSEKVSNECLSAAHSFMEKAESYLNNYIKNAQKDPAQ